MSPSRDVLDVIQSYVFLDRNGSRPIHEQLRNGIELAIYSGDISDGELLPSIRRLSQAFELAPATVLQAYNGLQAEGLIWSKPKRGFFVTVTEGDNADAESLATINRLLDEALSIALNAGLDSSNFLALAEKVVRERRTALRRVVVVGYADAYLAERVEWVRQAIADLGVDVIGISFEEMQSNGQHDIGGPSDIYLVPVGDWETARRLFNRPALNLIPMTRDLRPDVRERIARQPERSRFGVLEDTEDRIGRALSNLHLLHPLAVQPLAALVQDHDATADVIKHADVLLIGAHTGPYLEPHLPFPVEHIDFISIPDERTLRLLRSRLAE
jgi:GntR family transcriptional regulator